MDAVRRELRKTLHSSALCATLYLHGPNIDQAQWDELVRECLPEPVDDVHAAVPAVATVDCELVLSVRQLYESILNQLAGYPLAWHEGGGVRNWDGQERGLALSPSSSKKRKRNAEHTGRLEWDTGVSPDRLAFEPPRDSSEYFGQMLARLSALLGEAGAPYTRHHIVLHNAEYLSILPSSAVLSRGGSILNTLARLTEITIVPVSVIFTSRLGYEKIREPAMPLLKIVKWPALTLTDTVDMIANRYAPVDNVLPSSDYRTLFRGLVAHVADATSTYTAGRPKEIAYIVSRLWQAWKEPAEHGNPPCRVSDTARLAQGVKDLLSNEIQRIADARSWESLRPQGTTSFAGRLVNVDVDAEADPFMSAVAGDTNATSRTRNDNTRPDAAPKEEAAAAAAKAAPKRANESLVVSLPILARWLLLAAYYASVNRPSTDVRHFVRIDENAPQKGKKGKRRSPSKSPTKRSQQSSSTNKQRADLTGGRPFALDRLVAIFQAIAFGEGIPLASTDVLLQVNMLVGVRLLQRSSAESKAFEGVKLRCQLDRETAERLALSVGLKNWKDYLDELD